MLENPLLEAVTLHFFPDSITSLNATLKLSSAIPCRPTDPTSSLRPMSILDRMLSNLACILRLLYEQAMENCHLLYFPTKLNCNRASLFSLLLKS